MRTFFSLEGKVAVITGGGSGLGLATVKRFQEAGAKVVMADIEEKQEVAAQIGCFFVQTDVADEFQVEGMLKKAFALFGPIDILINNAGIVLPEQFIVHTNMEEVKRLLSINTLGVMHGLKYAPTYMRDGGAILNTASNSANGDMAGMGAYIASKCAVVGLTKAAAIEFAPRNIRVNCICPNMMDTPMAYVPGAETELAVVKIITPIPRLCQPEEAAALYHFLASDDCTYISGEDIYIDGGLKAGMSIQMIDKLKQ